MMQTTLFIGPVDFYYRDRVSTECEPSGGGEILSWSSVEKH